MPSKRKKGLARSAKGKAGATRRRRTGRVGPLILLGPPGAGKGTQAQEMAKHCRVPQISTGEILREAVRLGTPLGLEAQAVIGRGELVSDDIVCGIVEERIKQEDCRNGFVLDGFPRTIAQAKRLGQILSAAGFDRPKVIYLAVGVETLLRRLEGRRGCRVCGRIYNIYDRPPRVAGRCDYDGGELVQRQDDSDEGVMRARLKAYEQETAPLLDYYRSNGRVHWVDGKLSPEQITRRVLEVCQSHDRLQVARRA